jgi:alanine-glyoxylate transaminase/serine-glyoxylate transaminase/serine-pyruvate transaminase
MTVPERKLLLPGPTPVPMAVWQAMMEPMTNHRGPEGDALFQALSSGLQEVFGTTGVSAVMALSGTGGLEALLDNAVAPHAPILAVEGGAFGERWGRIAERRGYAVDWIHVPWGQGVDGEAVADRLRSRAYAAVLLTHNETSTGVLNPLPAIASTIRALVPLILVDSISGMPSVPLAMDAWEVDAVVAGSQKGFMLPPGLAVIAVRQDAFSRFAGRPSVYYDFQPHFRGDWPYTVPLSLMRGLARSLDLLREEGAERRHRRHATMGRMVRAGARALGFTVMADEAVASPTVTALEPPAGVAPDALRREVRRLGAEIAGGQGRWQDHVVRVGHVGAVGPLDVMGVLAALELALAVLDGSPVDGRGGAAALAAWQREEETAAT